ncbi:MAG: hypothetical protein JNN23_04810 [Chryseobacterium gambrini]|nr:hypothetical protein [Chryseobacterium gambrini]
MSDIKTKVSDFFKSEPNTKEVHATSDGFLFKKKTEAVDHAKTLNDDHPKVETFTNDDLPEPNPEQSEQLKKEYQDLFKELPAENLTDEEIENLINAELEK